MLITGKPFQFCTWNIARNFCSRWGGEACRTECMLHQVVIIENVMTFGTAVPILLTSFVYRTNVYWWVIHVIKRKPHLSLVWNWYHFVAIVILHQPRPTDSVDINTCLQLSDTSSIPQMHGDHSVQEINYLSPISQANCEILPLKLKGIISYKFCIHNSRTLFCCGNGINSQQINMMHSSTF